MIKAPLTTVLDKHPDCSESLSGTVKGGDGQRPPPPSVLHRSYRCLLSIVFFLSAIYRGSYKSAAADKQEGNPQEHITGIPGLRRSGVSRCRRVLRPLCVSRGVCGDCSVEIKPYGECCVCVPTAKGISACLRIVGLGCRLSLECLLVAVHLNHDLIDHSLNNPLKSLARFPV